jgi:hypothetical protein
MSFYTATPTPPPPPQPPTRKVRWYPFVIVVMILTFGIGAVSVAAVGWSMWINNIRKIEIRNGDQCDISKHCIAPITTPTTWPLPPTPPCTDGCDRP